MAVDQRHADGTRPFGKSTVILDKLEEAQDFLFSGNTDGSAPTRMLAITALYYLYGDQLTDDTNTVNAIVEHESGGGVIFYGAKHYQYKQDSEGSAVDMRSLLEQQGYSVAVVNIHETEKTRDTLNKYVFDSERGADIDFVVFPEEGHSGIHILNPEVEVDNIYFAEMQKSLDIM